MYSLTYTNVAVHSVSFKAVQRFILKLEDRRQRARLLKSMGISQPHTGFEHIWSVCGGKLEPVQLKVHREWLILFHIIFFSAAKEWHASVVCPCCLLGKEYLSSSDRCWHYHPYVLPGTGTGPMHRHGLTGASTRRQRQTAAHWFWMGKNGYAYFG